MKITIFMLLSVNSYVFTQQDTIQKGTDLFWFNFGPGASTEMSSLGVGFSYCFETTIISLRFIRNFEFRIMGPYPGESVGDIGILVGMISNNKYFKASISAGLSSVRGVRRGRYIGTYGCCQREYEKISFNTIGLPIESQLLLTPFSFLGIGINVFANINMEEAYLGALICLQIGKLH